MSAARVSLVMGPLAEPFTQQLAEFNLDADRLARFQRDMDAINWLHIQDLLTDSQVSAAREKLFKRIVKFVETSAARERNEKREAESAPQFPPTFEANRSILRQLRSAHLPLSA